MLVAISSAALALLACAGRSGGGNWRPMSSAGAPSLRSGIAGAWVAGRWLLWGGSGGCSASGLCGDGAAYDPARDAWQPLPAAGAPAGRSLHSALAAGDALLVWGGSGCSDLQSACDDGAAYDPARGVWEPVIRSGAPAARNLHTAVWTGREMAIWGGQSAGFQVFGDGGAWAPLDRSWRVLAAAGAPSARRHHSAIWTGSRMIIWGGSGGTSADVALGDGAAWNPADNTWTPLATTGAPAPRWAHSAVWTGKEMVVFGGLGCGRTAAGEPRLCGSGGRYDPAIDAWRPLIASGAPSPRVGHSAVWTGAEILVWGGGADACADGSPGLCADGAAWQPAGDRWRPIGSGQRASRRTGHLAVWTGTEMLVWGGESGGCAMGTCSLGEIYRP